MPYVDGFVVPLPKKNLPAYRALTRKVGKIWMEHGALAYYECLIDDIKPGVGLPFPKLAKLKPSETVCFSWIIYKSKAHRNSVNKKIMNDPRMNAMCGPIDKMPFDIKKMAYGGFKPLVALE